MKQSSVFLLVAGLILNCSAPLLALGNPTALQDQTQDRQPEIKTFFGRISRQGPKFVLEDSTLRTSYQLDDQRQAEKYQGRIVRVTGTLDAENNLIHVQMIQEAV